MKLLRTLGTLVAEMLTISPRMVAASAALMVVLSFTEGVGLLLLMPLLGLVGINGPSAMPNIAEWFGAGLALVGLKPTLGSVLALFVSIAGLRALLLRSQSWINAAVREDVTARMRVRVYQAIARAEWKFLVTRRPSEFVHVLAGEIGQVGSAALKIIDLAIVIVVSLVYLGLAFHFSAVMAVLVLSCACAMGLAVRSKLDEARASGARSMTARRKLHAVITEHVGSMKTVKSYGAAERHGDLFVRLSQDLRDMNLDVAATETNLQQTLEFASTALLAVIVYLSFKILGVTAAQLLLLLFVFSRLMPRLVSIYRRIQALATLLPVLDTVTNLEQECLVAAEPSPAGKEDVSLARSIRFEGVSFTYQQRAKASALCDVDLEVAAGFTTAIVGPSGAGKSTLADLLIGLLTPTMGRILIDDEPLSAGYLAAWRRQISYVPQETFLFHDTVRANLAWSRPGATDNELWDALRLSAADEFVSRLPHGLDTIVGERGVLISGGERQRLSLARALVRRPRILVLDEATSSLDSENELRIKHAVADLHRQMTIVIITHRLSTIRDADAIHVLDRGHVVESGTWDELMERRPGRLRELCRAQGIDHRPSSVGTDDRRFVGRYV